MIKTKPSIGTAVYLNTFRFLNEEQPPAHWNVILSGGSEKERPSAHERTLLRGDLFSHRGELCPLGVNILLLLPQEERRTLGGDVECRTASQNRLSLLYESYMNDMDLQQLSFQTANGFPFGVCGGAQQQQA